MDGDWRKVYTSTNRLRVDIVKATLEESDIVAFVMDKIDSSYNSFGALELYVPANQVIMALKIIQDDIQFE